MPAKAHTKRSTNVSSILFLVCTLQFLLITYLLLSADPLSQQAGRDLSIVKTSSSATQLFTYQENVSISSHVFCYGGEARINRQCHFKNLCYLKSSKRYVFYHAPESQIYGIPESYSVSDALIDLSSVANHDAMLFHMSNDSRGVLEKVSFYTHPSILMNRFNPDNLMHVIHDDLIPLLHTQRRYFPQQADITYIFMEGRDEGAYFDLYKSFTSQIIMWKDLHKVTCFENVIVGVSKATTWYQYGFHKPQGPLNLNNYPKNELKYFQEAILSSFDLQRSENQEAYIVYFTRVVTRRILNEAQFIFRLMRHFKMPVKTVSLENDNMREIMSLVSNAAIAVGVHGAHFSLAVLMRPKTILIEIFPFAIPAWNYTPYKTLCHLKSIKYISWENRFENKSVTHEDWPPHLGGIHHLPPKYQLKIRNEKRIEQHLCCNDPSWLFRIYQDTAINEADFFQYIQNEF